MELHKALRNIIQTDGPEIIKEVRLVNILDDFNAYKDIPAAKYILRAIIADGFAQKLLLIGEWNNESRQLMTKFIAATGFSNQLVETIFKGIAYGLTWNNTEPTIEKVTPEVPLAHTDTGDHMKFMGIPITGSPNDFINELKKKGFKRISKKRVEELVYENNYGNLYADSKDCYMTGNFSVFTACILHIVVSPFTGEVYAVFVLPFLSPYIGLEIQRHQYNEIIDMLVQKYGPISPKIDPIENDLIEIKEGWISLEISGDEDTDEIYTFCVDYYDGIGFDKHTKEEERKAIEDL